MIADSPGRLLESQIVNNLNPPPAFADTSWIKPGKASWDWWSGPYDENVSFKPGKNIETSKHYVDFSAQAGFPYFMLRRRLGRAHHVRHQRFRQRYHQADRRDRKCPQF